MSGVFYHETASGAKDAADYWPRRKQEGQYLSSWFFSATLRLVLFPSALIGIDDEKLFFFSL